MKQLQSKNVLVLGLGLSGLAMARWCVRWGATVTVADTRMEPPQLPALRREVPQAVFVHADSGGVSALCNSADAIYRSPGLAPNEVLSMCGQSVASKVVMGGELDLFVAALDELRESQSYVPQVLAVTGTNGKTTVTSLTGQLVQRAGKTVVVAGNIGPTLLDTLSTHLDTNALPDVWVLELSSFQLYSVGHFEPTAATVLNLSEDHLDWHGSMDSYVASKRKVFGTRAWMVVNRQDSLVWAMKPVAPKGRAQKSAEVPMITFGADLPTRPGDFGIESVNGMSWLVRAMEADATQRGRKDDAEPVHIQRLMPTDALRIRGRHNALNALAALALASTTGCALAPMLYGLREYEGEPHRVEPVAIVNDVEYFDDSKGTNVGATVAALNGLGVDRKIVVILGGEGKGQDFSPLIEPVRASARAVLLIGRDAPQLRHVLEQAEVPLWAANTMSEAVLKASQCASPGDAVLMSPACASFDMFDNYEHRAVVFRRAVMEIAQAAGQPFGGAA